MFRDKTVVYDKTRQIAINGLKISKKDHMQENSIICNIIS